MSPFILHQKGAGPSLSVPIWFLTEYMPEANGDFVKVYLFLLLTASRSEASLSVDTIADELSCTESDVIRALKYWEKRGLLLLVTGADGSLHEVELIDPTPEAAAQTPAFSTPVSAVAQTAAAMTSAPQPVTPDIPKEPQVAARRAPQPVSSASVLNDPEFQTLVMVSEQYLGRTLSRSDVDIFASWYHDTDHNFDLIDHLVQYCVERQIPRLDYMNKVLINWQNAGIKTVQEAKDFSKQQSEDMWAVFRELGITNHRPTTEEAGKLDYWRKNLGFSMEMILEACRRTIRSIQSPNFNYVQGILEDWNKQNVHDMEALKKADEAFDAEKAGRGTGKRSSAERRSGGVRRSASSPNRFHNFEQRSYDYQEWQQDLLSPYQNQNPTPDPVPDTAGDSWADTLLASYQKKG